MKKFMKQFEGLRLTSRGEWVFVLSFAFACGGTVLAADFVGGVA